MWNKQFKKQNYYSFQIYKINGNIYFMFIFTGIHLANNYL